MRIAEVYPVTRLPRRFSFFDYAVPSGMALERGAFVRIPLRARSVRGVVRRVREEEIGDTRKLKPIERVLPDQALSDADVTRFERLAADLVQSVSALLHAALPVPPKRTGPVASRFKKEALTIPSMDAAHIERALAFVKPRPRASVASPTLRTSVAIVAAVTRTLKNASLVLCPNVRDAEAAARHLGALIVTGNETPGARSRTWDEWRRMGGVLVGTRTAALLPCPKLDGVFVLRSGHENHKQADRNPRFDARRVATQIAETFSARLVHLDACPRVNDLASFGADNVLSTDASFASVVDMGKERPIAVHPALSPSLLTAIEEAIETNGRSLLIYNRKGVFQRLRCADCGWSAPLTDPFEPIPSACPTCHRTKLVRKGFGIRALARALETFVPGVRVATVDKEGPVGDLRRANVILATSFYLENLFDPFHPEPFSIFGLIDADQPLHDTNVRAPEIAMREAYAWLGVAQAMRARAFIQTDAPNFFTDAIQTPLMVLDRERAARESYGEPPYGRRIRLTEHGGSEDGLKTVAENLRTALPDIDPIASPDAVTLLVSPDRFSSVLEALSGLDDRFVIDTDA